MTTHPQLHSADIDWIVTQVGRWLDLRIENGWSEARGEDADHSSLLRWLLTGHEPLRYPPPKTFSQPNYYAASGRETYPMDVHFGPDMFLGERRVAIDQNNWNIVRQQGSNYYIKHGADPAEWLLRARTDAEFEQAITDRQLPSPLKDDAEYRASMLKHYAQYHRWVLKRLSHDQAR